MHGDAQKALGAAAELYQKELKALQPIHKARKGRKRSPANWTREERAREVKVLAAAREIEAEAITAIEKALGAEGVGL